MFYNLKQASIFCELNCNQHILIKENLTFCVTIIKHNEKLITEYCMRKEKRWTGNALVCTYDENKMEFGPFTGIALQTSHSLFIAFFIRNTLIKRLQKLYRIKWKRSKNTAKVVADWENAWKWHYFNSCNTSFIKCLSLPTRLLYYKTQEQPSSKWSYI